MTHNKTSLCEKTDTRASDPIPEALMKYLTPEHFVNQQIVVPAKDFLGAYPNMTDAQVRLLISGLNEELAAMGYTVEWGSRGLVISQVKV